MCSGSVVVTAYNFESGRLDSYPEWGAAQYEASNNAPGSTEPSSLQGSTLGTREAGACKLIDGCSIALSSAPVSVVSAGICHRFPVQ